MTPPIVLPPPGKPGVTVVPPAAVSIDIHRQVQLLLNSLPAGRTRAMVSIETRSGVNLAVAHKFDDHWAVEAWVGKSGWDKPVAGGAMLVFSH